MVNHRGTKTDCSFSPLLQFVKSWWSATEARRHSSSTLRSVTVTSSKLWAIKSKTGQNEGSSPPLLKMEGHSQHSYATALNQHTSMLSSDSVYIYIKAHGTLFHGEEHSILSELNTSFQNYIINQVHKGFSHHFRQKGSLWLNVQLLMQCTRTLRDVHYGWKTTENLAYTVQLFKKDFIMQVVDQTDRRTEAAECFTE